MEYLKKFKSAFIIMSILYVLLGITLIARPELSALVICKLFGTIALIVGIIRIIGFYRRNDYGSLLRVDMVHGLLCIILGSFMLIAPKVVISVLPVMLGIVIIIDSILRFQMAFDLKRLQYEKWWMHLSLAIITVVLGAMLLFNPFAGGIVLTRFIGITLTIDGAVNLWGIIFITGAFERWI
jgi:uncharacterized membrane protein HdeD (DUF308 family)